MQKQGTPKLLAVTFLLASSASAPVGRGHGQDLATLEPEAQIETAIDGLDAEQLDRRQSAYETLTELGIRAAPQLLKHRLDPALERRRRIADLLRKAYRFQISALSLDKASLPEACQTLTEVSGVHVRAEGEARRPITLDLKNISFWEAVIAICQNGRVGLAPHSASGEQWPLTGLLPEWMPGATSKKHPVILGKQYPRPKNAFVDGPVLVLLKARPIHGERAVLLGMQVRYVPDLPIRALTKPPITDARDHEG